jgi:hypothetical protein
MAVNYPYHLRLTTRLNLDWKSNIGGEHPIANIADAMANAGFKSVAFNGLRVVDVNTRRLIMIKANDPVSPTAWGYEYIDNRRVFYETDSSNLPTGTGYDDTYSQDGDIGILSNGSIYRKESGSWELKTFNTGEVYSAGTGLTLTGNVFSHTPHTGDVTGATELTIGAGKVTTDKILNEAVTIAKIGATGNPGDSNYLRGDGKWATPPGTDYSPGTNIGIVENVISFKIENDILPETGDSHDIGFYSGTPGDSTNKRFKDLYLSGNVNADNGIFKGELGVDQTLAVSGRSTFVSGFESEGNSSVDGNLSITNGQAYTPQNNVSSAATIAIDFDTSNVQFVSVDTDVSTISPSNIQNGSSYIVMLKVTGTRSVTFHSDFINIGTRSLADGYYSWSGVCIEDEGSNKLYGVFDEAAKNLI